MPKVIFIDNSGARIEVESEIGETVLDVTHKHNIPLEGACGGAIACSTCHVVIDQEWFDKLPPAEEHEHDVLDYAWGVTKTSRLGCQVKITEDLDGMVVHLPKKTGS